MLLDEGVGLAAMRAEVSLVKTLGLLIARFWVQLEVLIPTQFLFNQSKWSNTLGGVKKGLSAVTVAPHQAYARKREINLKEMSFS